jgi:hypothetical protein
VAALVWIAAALGVGGPYGPTSVALAAAPDLTVVTAARYDVRPDNRRIDVTVDLTATNRLVDTSTTRYTFEQAYLAVQPQATGFAVSSASGSPTVAVDDVKPTHILVRIAFGTSLGAGRSTRLTLTYRLPDPGAPPDRDFRVGPTLTTLQAWALASTDTPGSTVTVTVPPDYAVTFVRGSIPGPTTDAAGRSVWTSAPIQDPLKYDVYVRVERQPELVDTALGVPVGAGIAQLTLRAWSDDPGWAERIGALLRDGIPGLEAAIGRPWPLARPLTVEEVLDPATAGIAGTFDPVENRIEVVYSAGPEIALHEVAHAWFNGGLLADRWANEAFASYYAEVVAKDLGLPFEPAAVTPELEGASVPLNAWAPGDVPPPEGADRSPVEAYGYAASANLARRIAERSGPSGLQRLWSAIDAGVAPYQPPGGPTEFLTGPPDWRGLLDLLEDDGRSRVADLWLGAVVLPDEATMVLDRDAARRAYAAALKRAGDWHLPGAIRAALRGWQFDIAQSQLSIALAVFDARDELLPVAAAAGLTLPPGLPAKFESASDLTAVRVEIELDLDAVIAIGAARAARPSAPGPVEWLGLVGSASNRQLADAIKALADGDPARAGTLARAAETTWQGAGDAGRIRVLAMAGIVAAGLVLGVAWLRRRKNPAA